MESFERKRGLSDVITPNKIEDAYLKLEPQMDTNTEEIMIN